MNKLDKINSNCIMYGTYDFEYTIEDYLVLKFNKYKIPTLYCDLSYDK